MVPLAEHWIVTTCSQDIVFSLRLLIVVVIFSERGVGKGDDLVRRKPTVGKIWVQFWYSVPVLKIIDRNTEQRGDRLVACEGSDTGQANWGEMIDTSHAVSWPVKLRASYIHWVLSRQYTFRAKFYPLLPEIVPIQPGRCNKFGKTRILCMLALDHHWLPIIDSWVWCTHIS